MTRYPQRFISDVNDKTKKIFLVEPPKGYLGDCENCGGLGMMSAFYPSKGPFVHTPPCPSGEILKSVNDSQYGWVWYTGKSFDLECPVCNGIGKTTAKPKRPMSLEEYEKQPRIMIKQLAKEKRVPIARENPVPVPMMEGLNNADRERELQLVHSERPAGSGRVLAGDAVQ